MGKENLGWGTAVGKVFNWFPSKEESLKNEIDKLKKQMSELQGKRPFTGNDSLKYAALADKLCKAEARYKNI